MAGTNVYTGSNGTLTLATEDTAEGKDAKTVLDFFALTTVGRVSDVEVYVRTDLEEFHEIGRRHPTSLHSGNVHISGKIGRAYINGALLDLLLGRGSAPTAIPEPYVQPTFNLSLVLSDLALPGNSASLELKGVKFENWSFELPEEDFVMENVTFRALKISTLDKETPAGGGGASASLGPTFADSATA
jgi:hypothetical protein